MMSTLWNIISLIQTAQKLMLGLQLHDLKVTDTGLSGSFILTNLNGIEERLAAGRNPSYTSSSTRNPFLTTRNQVDNRNPPLPPYQQPFETPHQSTTTIPSWRRGKGIGNRPAVPSLTTSTQFLTPTSQSLYTNNFPNNRNFSDGGWTPKATTAFDRNTDSEYLISDLTIRPASAVSTSFRPYAEQTTIRSPPSDRTTTGQIVVEEVSDAGSQDGDTYDVPVVGNGVEDDYPEVVYLSGGTDDNNRLGGDFGGLEEFKLVEGDGNEGGAITPFDDYAIVDVIDEDVDPQGPRGFGSAVDSDDFDRSMKPAKLKTTTTTKMTTTTTKKLKATPKPTGRGRRTRKPKPNSGWRTKRPRRTRRPKPVRTTPLPTTTTTSKPTTPTTPKPTTSRRTFKTLTIDMQKKYFQSTPSPNDDALTNKNSPLHSPRFRSIAIISLVIIVVSGILIIVFVSLFVRRGGEEDECTKDSDCSEKQKCMIGTCVLDIRCPKHVKFGKGPRRRCRKAKDPNNLPKSGLESWFTRAAFNDLFPKANIGHGPRKCSPYNYDSFIIAARYFPRFGTESPDNGYSKRENNRRDLSAFFAHAVQETGENDASLYPGRPQEDGDACFYRGGFFNWFEGGPTSSFLPRKHPGYQPEDGDRCVSAGKYCASGGELDYWFQCNNNETDSGHESDKESYYEGCYFGRGAIQISYNYNYGQFQRWLHQHNIKVDLLANPNLVMTNRNPPLAVLASLWFYMTPQPPKPSMHDIVLGNWNAGAENKAAGYTGPIFGPTSLVINNECNGEDEDTPGGPGESRRIKAFKWFNEYFGIKTEDDDLLSCKGMPQLLEAIKHKLSWQPDWTNTWKKQPCDCAPASYGGMLPYIDPEFYPSRFAEENERNRIRCVQSIYANPSMYGIDPETTACLDYPTPPAAADNADGEDEDLKE